MKYIVTGEKRESVEMSVEAESRDAAVLAFKTAHPGFDPEALDEDIDDGDGWAIIGQCEATGEFIFDGDDFVTDPESGIRFLRKNLPDGTTE